MRLELGKTATNYFTVIDSNYQFITGLTGFSTTLISPSEVVYSDELITITELGSGRYKSEFEPDATGNWYIEVRNETYFPYGKSDVIEVDTVEAMYNRLMGLNHENYVLDTIGYNIDGKATVAKIHLYTDTGLTDEFATYQTTSTYDVDGNMTKHQVKRIA